MRENRNRKNLDRLYYYDRYESWYLEFWDDDSGQRFVYQRDFHLSELEIDWKTLCAECGKIRSREVELLNLEIRKVKATENIGIAISQIGTAVERMKYELQRFNDHDGYRG